jgi:hypothetical protein
MGRYVLRTAAHKRNTTKPETQSQKIYTSTMVLRYDTTAFQQCKRIKLQLVKETRMAVSAMGQSPMRSIDIGEKPSTTEETISGNDFELFEVLKWAYDLEMIALTLTCPESPVVVRA